ncbi:hypothetical protein TI05_15465 [Achromatium sp. WMS3]|nr:hypothetical protein TI05_15465 [Achromatium sp. WMS3]
MYDLQITDDVATQLYKLAKYRNMTAIDLIGQLIKLHSAKITKRENLKSFFAPYQRNMTEFEFDR